MLIPFHEASVMQRLAQHFFKLLLNQLSVLRTLASLYFKATLDNSRVSTLSGAIFKSHRKFWRLKTSQFQGMLMICILIAKFHTVWPNWERVGGELSPSWSKSKGFNWINQGFHYRWRQRRLSSPPSNKFLVAMQAGARLLYSFKAICTQLVRPVSKKVHTPCMFTLSSISYGPPFRCTYFWAVLIISPSVVLSESSFTRPTADPSPSFPLSHT